MSRRGRSRQEVAILISQPYRPSPRQSGYSAASATFHREDLGDVRLPQLPANYVPVADDIAAHEDAERSATYAYFADQMIAAHAGERMAPVAARLTLAWLVETLR